MIDYKLVKIHSTDYNSTAGVLNNICGNVRSLTQHVNTFSKSKPEHKVSYDIAVSYRQDLKQFYGKCLSCKMCNIVYPGLIGKKVFTFSAGILSK